MTFPNAYHGVKKIFTAELLKLIGAVCLLIAAILGLTSLIAADSASETGFAASGIGTLVFMAAGVVLPIIGYIINLVGLHQAGKDDEYFHNAFIVAIFALIIIVLSAIFKLLPFGGGFADDVANTVSRICELIVFVLVVSGCTSLAEKLGKSSMIGSGNTVLWFYIIVFGLSIIADLVIIIFGLTEATTTIAGILSLASAILSIIAYIIYLVFLGRAKTMLRDN